MNMVRILICAVALSFAALQASAAPALTAKSLSPANPHLSAEVAVAKYMKSLVGKKSKSNFDIAGISTHLEPVCHERSSCVDAACKYSNNCQYSSDLNNIIQLCRGVDGDCVEGACHYSNDCQYSSDLSNIIKACASTNGDCVKAACEYSNDCQYSSDLSNIMKQCNGADGDCVRSACKYSNNCQYSSDLANIIRSCGGQ